MDSLITAFGLHSPVRRAVAAFVGRDYRHDVPMAAPAIEGVLGAPAK